MTFYRMMFHTVLWVTRSHTFCIHSGCVIVAGLFREVLVCVTCYTALRFVELMYGLFPVTVIEIMQSSWPALEEHSFSIKSHWLIA